MPLAALMVASQSNRATVKNLKTTLQDMLVAFIESPITSYDDFVREYAHTYSLDPEFVFAYRTHLANEKKPPVPFANVASRPRRLAAQLSLF